eukprot:SAG11_NODE_77_length_17985_cov_25.875657_4_plen_275_part_00
MTNLRSAVSSPRVSGDTDDTTIGDMPTVMSKASKAVERRRTYESTMLEMSDEFYETNVAHRCEVPRGTVVETITDDHGKTIPLCLHCRIQAEKMSEASTRIDFGGGVFTAAELVQRDDARRAEEDEEAAAKATRREEREVKRQAKQREEREKEEWLEKKTREIDAAMALPFDMEEWVDCIAAFDALDAAIKGTTRKTAGGRFKAARDRRDELDAVRKRCSGATAAETSRHATAVDGHTAAVMEIIQDVRNAAGFDPAAVKVRVRALVESMSSKF